VRIGIIVLVITQCFNAVFVPFLSHAGLALSIGLGSLVNATWLLIGLRRSGRYQPSPGWWLFALRVGVASAILGVGLWLGVQHIDGWACARSPWCASARWPPVWWAPRWCTLVRWRCLV